MLRGFLTVDAGECVSRHQQKSDFYMRSNILHVFFSENTALKMKDSTRVELVFMTIETWSLNCLTALTYDDGFFSWLSSYEIKRLERTIIWIPCKNRGENGALFQKIFFYSLLLSRRENSAQQWVLKFLLLFFNAAAMKQRSRRRTEFAGHKKSLPGH